MSKNYVLAKGRIYFDPFDANGAITGERYLGNTPGFSVSVETESLEHFDDDTGIREKDDEVLLEVKRTAALEIDNITEINLALFVIGQEATVAQSSGSVVAEAITVQQDRYYQLGTSTSNPTGVRGITNVVVSGSGGTPTYTVATDYTVDLVLGRLYIVSGGTIADDTAIEVDYDTDANSRAQVATASLAATEGALRYVADNPKGINRDLYSPKVQLKPNGEMSLKGEGWMKFSLDVEFLKRDATTEALYLDGRAA
jgi:hypothetical protein